MPETREEVSKNGKYLVSIEDSSQNKRSSGFLIRLDSKLSAQLLWTARCLKFYVIASTSIILTWRMLKLLIMLHRNAC